MASPEEANPIDVEDAEDMAAKPASSPSDGRCSNGCRCTWKRVLMGILIFIPVGVCAFFIYLRIGYKGFFAPRCAKPRKEIESLDSLDDCMQQIYEKYGFAGISISVMTINDDDADGGTAIVDWSQNYGFANLEEETPATSDTPYLLSSISKTFIGTAIMQQVEIGALDLDVNINTYNLPFTVDNPLVDSETIITLRQLATHTSGIADGPAYDTSYAPGDPQEGLGEFLEAYFVPGGVHYSTDNFQECQSGDCEYQYCNVAAALAAYVLEVALGISYAQYVEENIFQPLGMNNSHFYLDNYTDPNVIAMPYEEGPERNSGLEAYGYYGYPTYPDGYIKTSTNDMNRYMAAFLSDEEILMTTATQNEMMTVQPINHKPSFVDRLIYGDLEQEIFWVKTNVISQGHDGGDYGSFTLMYYEPKEKVGIVVLTNYAELNGSIVLFNIFKQVTQQSARVAGLLRGEP